MLPDRQEVLEALSIAEVGRALRSEPAGTVVGTAINTAFQNEATLAYAARVNVLARYARRRWGGTTVHVNEIAVLVEEEQRLGRISLEFRAYPALSWIERYLRMLETLVPWRKDRVEVTREQAIAILTCVEQLERLAAPGQDSQAG